MTTYKRYWNIVKYKINAYKSYCKIKKLLYIKAIGIFLIKNNYNKVYKKSIEILLNNK